MKHNLNTLTKVLEIVVPGDILSTNVDALRVELFELLERPDIARADWSVLRLDLADAQMVDSMGLNLIVALVRMLQTRGVRLEVRVLNLNIQRTFMFTRLDKQLDLITA